MDIKIIQQLEEYGCEPKEAHIYLAILESSPASISIIARKAGIKRPTVYNYIEILMAKGLIHKTASGKRVLYIAEDPQKLIKILENKKKTIEDILPNLKSMYGKTSHKPQIRFYEGREGMRTIWREMTHTTQDLYTAFSVDKYLAQFTQKDDEEFFENVRKSGGKIFSMVEDTPMGKKYAKQEAYKGVGQARILPSDFQLSVDLEVTGNKVAMLSMVNLVGVIIENEEIAELQRNMMRFLWKSL